MTIRHLLAQEPLSFNELLDLFEGYVSLVSGPLLKGHEMLRDEIGMGEHEALGEVFGVAEDAQTMAKRLSQIRIARNSGTDVSLTMTQGDARGLAFALDEFDRVFSATASALEVLHMRAVADSESEDTGGRAMMTLTLRAMFATDEEEGEQLRRFSRKLRATGAFLPFDEEEAA